MSRSLLIGVAAMACVAMAPMAAAQDGAIVVSGPRVETSGEARVGVQPSKMVVSQVAVPTHDLDLRTAYGRDVLDHRVKMAAREVCSRLDEVYVTGGPAADPGKETRDCRFEAEKSARAQVRAAVWNG